MSNTPTAEQEIHLINPHGGELCELIASPERVAEIMKSTDDFKDLTLTDRQLCDCELLLNGGFSPLRGFMNKEDYEGVVEKMRLASGILFPMPINLDVSKEKAESYKVGDKLALRDLAYNLIAVLTIESIYVPDKAKEAEKVFGSPSDTTHPSINYLFNTAGSHYIGGSLEGVQLPIHYDFLDLRFTPSQLRQQFQSLCWSKVVGFQTRNPMHRSHRELTLHAARDAQANILIHPVVGMTKPGDVDHYTRVRCYKEMLRHYATGMAKLSLLPLAMRMGGPREAVWHAIIRKNYGCNYFVVGRDHAGPGKNKDGKDWYGPYDAQTLVDSVKEDLQITILKYQMVVYVEELSDYRTIDNVPEGMKVLNISGTELRRRLYMGIDIPEWFSFPSVVKILRQRHPARVNQGFCLFFTGLSGAGKSTIANAVRVALLEEGSRPVSLLDGDEVRTHLSTELGFSKEHRDLNVKRIAYVASQIVKSGGIAITAAIAPYRAPRDYARDIISPQGGFFEIYIATPLEVCEERDVKGLYARARKGVLKGFTGIDDPYEEPVSPNLIVDASKNSVRQAVHNIILHLEQEGYLGPKATQA